MVFADYFRRADIIFKPTRKSRDNNTDLDGDEENSSEGRVFSFFRSKIHTPVFRMIFANVIHLFYLALLYIAIENPDKTGKRAWTRWYFLLPAIFTFFFLLEDFMKMITFKNFRRSFWNPYSLVIAVLP